MKSYYVIACHLLWRDICHYASLSGNNFDFRFLEQGLHNTPDILRTELQAAINDAPGDCDAVLVGYGLCSRGIDGLKAGKTRLVFMRGHDCITFLLGSKEQYGMHAEHHPDTYWFSPGWIEAEAVPGRDDQEKKLREYIELYGEDNASYLMEVEQDWQKKYSKAVFVDPGFLDTSVQAEYTKECADWLGWNYETVKGDPGLLRRYLEGEWDIEDFLVLEPGETVVASNDGRIIRVK